MANTNLYTANILKELQHAVNSNNVIITPYKDYSFLNHGIKSCGIFIKYFIDNGRYSKMMNLPDDLTTELMSIWKTYPINKFLFKDWKNDKRDFLGNTVYNEIKFTTSDNKPLRALIRKLEEINEDTLTEQEKLEYIKENCDLIIDGRYFSVLKIQELYDETSAFWADDDKLAYINFSLDGIIESSNVNEEDEVYNDTELNENIEGLF